MERHWPCISRQRRSPSVAFTTLKCLIGCSQAIQNPNNIAIEMREQASVFQ